MTSEEHERAGFLHIMRHARNFLIAIQSFLLSLRFTFIFSTERSIAIRRAKFIGSQAVFLLSRNDSKTGRPLRYSQYLNRNYECTTTNMGITHDIFPQESSNRLCVSQGTEELGAPRVMTVMEAIKTTHSHHGHNLGYFLCILPKRRTGPLFEKL